MAGTEWWIPDLNGQDVHGPEKLSRILGRENPVKIAAMELPLVKDIVSAGWGMKIGHR
jgi:hypothetical protein